ncbi:hypothetical protein E4L96_04365 [Massilia arenosa]|uniref:Uncharacterized protein n=2 Tax=Zemynaea arenosa TaxID=2561931 RepID=A0A4Y9SJE3_9BURK|nr:hypothetical protein E4L96_04365 [Massilia arenosa]
MSLARWQLVAQAKKLGADEQAQARHAELVTTYFRQLTGAEKEDFMSLQPAFAAVARQLKDPCRKADALFFAALMPQVANRVLESAAGMEQARATAAAAQCELELSYAYRHLAEVAEARGNLAEAARLSDQSLALRRQLKFQVFLPYSLLQTANYADKLGDHRKAGAQRAEALALAQRLHLPAQEKAAQEALAAVQR